MTKNKQIKDVRNFKKLFMKQINQVDVILILIFLFVFTALLAHLKYKLFQQYYIRIGVVTAALPHNNYLIRSEKKFAYLRTIE